MTTLDFKEYEKILKEVQDLSKLKNSDYGCNSLKKFGNLGIFIRVSDKLDRLHNLIYEKQIPLVNDEKIEDTLKDIINYCIYMIMQQRGKLENAEEN